MKLPHRIVCAALCCAFLSAPLVAGAQSASGPAMNALPTATANAASTSGESTAASATAFSVAPSAPDASASTRAGKPAEKASAHADNPYGIGALWMQSDVVAKSVLVILVIMSASSWYVIVLKLLEQHGISRHSRSAAKVTQSPENLWQAAEALPPLSPFRRIVAAGLDSVRRHAPVVGKVSLDDWIAQATDRAIDRVQRKLQGGMAVLATVGSTAPFVGLFGTVWGIYHALTAIGVAGQASIDKVAGPVGEALIMTAIGLAVAVPAVLGYNWLLRRNKSVMDDLRDFGGDVHSALLATS